ncbi:MAG: hypothetical protein K2K78_06965 [Muribaculaceae bacterium]|nr:hypothetical protein [Muribaculaceae bacterium]
MKRLKHLLWVLLGVAASITLWACGEEQYAIDDNGPHPFVFYVEDEDGNDILIDRLNCEMITNDLVISKPYSIAIVEGRCSIVDGELTHDDEWIVIYKYPDGREYAEIDPIVTYTKFWIRLFDDDAEEIVFEAKDPKVDFYKITWMFKGKNVKKIKSDGINVPVATLVRHNDGTYTLKE